jgi:hypothetical protein
MSRSRLTANEERDMHQFNANARTSLDQYVTGVFRLLSVLAKQMTGTEEAIIQSRALMTKVDVDARRDWTEEFTVGHGGPGADAGADRPNVFLELATGRQPMPRNNVKRAGVRPASDSDSVPLSDP